MVEPRFSALTRSVSFSDWRRARAQIWLYLLNLQDKSREGQHNTTESQQTEKLAYVKAVRQVLMVSVVVRVGFVRLATAGRGDESLASVRGGPGSSGGARGN